MNQYTSISELLSSIGLASYLEAFDASDITLDICSTLSDQDLKDIGVASLGHRRKLLVTFAAISTAEPLKSEKEVVVPDWVGSLPAILAIGIDEYYKEQDPVLKLWHVCDIAELTLRLLTIAGLSELRNIDRQEGKYTIGELFSQIKLSLELPTMGKWQHVATAVAAKLGSNSPSAKLKSVVEQELVPLLDGKPGEGKEWSLRNLRNQLAHGGGMTKARAKMLLERWANRFDQFLFSLKATKEMHLVVRTPNGFGLLQGPTSTAIPWEPRSKSEFERVENAFQKEGDILIAGDEVCFSLWPLSLYSVSFDDGKSTTTATPQVYVRRGHVGLVYTPIGSSDASQHTTGEETAAAFEEMLKVFDQAKISNKVQFKVAGFESQMEREAQNLVCRTTELETIYEWIKSKKNQVGLILGSAGTGKSLIMAKVCTDLLDANNTDLKKNELLVYRFKGGDDRSNRESFLTFIGERIASWLNRPIGDEIPSVTLVCSLIMELDDPLILIDGLDEIAEVDSSFMLDVLLPIKEAGTRLLCAGRPETWVKSPMQQLQAEYIFPDGLPLMSDSDIRTMILERTGPLRRIFLVRDLDEGDNVKNDAIETIIKSAGGLPLYINYVIGDLLSRRLTLDTLGQLPPTLAAYHERLLQRGQIGDLALINTPLIASLSIGMEPLDINELAETLICWGVLSRDEKPKSLIELSLRAVESMIRRSPDPDGNIGFSPYHHSLRQHVITCAEMKHAVARARRTFRDLAIEIGKGKSSDFGVLRDYMFRQGAQHLSREGTPAETLAFVTAVNTQCGPIERKRNLGALNESLIRGEGLSELDPQLLFNLLLELHDGAEITPGARALYLYHRDFLTSNAAESLLLGFSLTYELAHEIAKIESKRNDSKAIQLLLEWTTDHHCPAQYVACYALNYLFMNEPELVPKQFLTRLATSNPYDRMVVLNALTYRAIEGKSPFDWVQEGPFWNTRWPYLSRDAALVKACFFYSSGSPSDDNIEVDEIKKHLDTIGNYAHQLVDRLSQAGDQDLAAVLNKHWFVVADQSQLRQMRTRCVVNKEWLSIGKLLLSNPFWQVASVGAEILAERYITSPSDRYAIDQLLQFYEPFPGAGLIGDRDLGMVDLARLTLLDDKDPVLIASRLGPFLQSQSCHQRAEAALLITQLIRNLSDSQASALLDHLSVFLTNIKNENDLWAIHELVELHKVMEERGIPLPKEFDLNSSPILQKIPDWKNLEYLEFTDMADKLFECFGIRKWDL